MVSRWYIKPIKILFAFIFIHHSQRFEKLVVLVGWKFFFLFPFSAFSYMPLYNNKNKLRSILGRKLISFGLVWSLLFVFHFKPSKRLISSQSFVWCLDRRKQKGIIFFIYLMQETHVNKKNIYPFCRRSGKLWFPGSCLPMEDQSSQCSLGSFFLLEFSRKKMVMFIR